MSATTIRADHPENMTHRQTMEALTGLLLVLFVAMTSGTIVSTALPTIIGSLNGSQTQYTWVVTATLLAATASTPIWGKLADLFSKKMLIQVSIVIFVVGSLISGAAQNTEQLIGARAIQGLGVGGLQALVQVAIAAMIPPRERGKYNGYLSAVMAVATVGGPLLGGLIVDTTWLGWRWCFYIGVPFAIASLFVLQKTLRLPFIRRDNVKIDYFGATLIAAGVSILLVWISFVDSSFAWLSWQTLALAGGGVLLLALAVVVETRVPEPVISMKVIRQPTTALAIIASLAVGMAMFGGAVFLGQYFQIGRGYTPTEAGLLTIPMMLGVMISSTVCGRLISISGKVKPYIVAGSVVLIGGFLILSTIDHQTSLLILSAGMLLVGLGVGATMQNLVLMVQNTVALKDIGSASASIAFFRSMGGTIGISVLGAVLARRVQENMTAGLTALGIDPAASGGTSALNLTELPAPVVAVVRGAYGDATGHIFLISAAIAVISVVASLLLKPTVLRSSLDLPATENGPDAVAVPAGAPATKAPESDGRGAGPDSDGRGGPPKAAGLK
ncbi:MDR family MFS transporter [Melissospora conviva]|uniref:MDR family MFS transporter n=1 Tax=Melissospora conviva TaxID=3388432 RepID=UPI003C190C5F